MVQSTGGESLILSRRAHVPAPVPSPGRPEPRRVRDATTHGQASALTAPVPRDAQQLGREPSHHISATPARPRPLQKPPCYAPASRRPAMTTRQPLQPPSPPPAHAVTSRYHDAHVQRPTAASSAANGRGTMHASDGDPDGELDAASLVSGLSSLENDAEDEFDKLMIRNERDQRRLSHATQARPQPFAKARARPRVGLTLENLERNSAEAAATRPPTAQLESPPSSSGSIQNDPSMHAPASWGRKSRSNRSWMRAITGHDGQHTPVAAADDDDDDAPNGLYNNVGVPHRSVQDSPLSHKTSMHGTPRPATPDEWDLTFELNEASMIASTPYIPRSTVLDDIRQREMETATEQAQDTTRGSEPDHASRRSSFTQAAENAHAAPPKLAPALQESPPPQNKLRSRKQSWQSMSKSQPVLGVTKERMPAAMYKSTESIATVDRQVIATVEKSQPKRVPHRRKDSQDLLRRLARASNTPSPARPQTTPPGPLDGASETATVRTASSRQEDAQDAGDNASVPTADAEPMAPVPEASEAPHKPEQAPEPPTETEAEAKGGDATPMPAQRILNPKTPVVTGAWVDTPGPRTAQRSSSISTERDRSRSQSRSSRKSSMSKDKSPERPPESGQEAPAKATIEPIRPQLPRSALQALVEEAKAHRKESSTDFGDSTINSLEELITPLTEIAMDDTLQGLQVPTDAPRNDAERQRQQELVHLHRMNDRLRAARTSIRDASRGMKRVEDQVEHVEEGEAGEKIKVTTRTCLCTSDHVHTFSMWRWWKSLFWEQRLKTLRQKSDSRWKVWGGLTGLSIFLIFFLAWLVSEEIAW